MSRERQGTLLVLVSAAGFGAMAILAKLAYGAGLDVVTLLALRFALAATVLWVVVRLRRTPVRRRPLLLGLALGAGGYAVEAGLFFTALERLDASLASLLLYAYPAFVTIGALLLGREHPTARRWFALAVASAGVVLVLGGGGSGADPLGVVLALGSGVGYAGYILGTDSVVRSVDPLAFAASVSTGACLTFLAAGVAQGGLDLDVAAEGWLWLAAIAFFSTVVPIAAFAGGVGRIGPSRASILSTVEPPFTVALAMVVFGDSLGALQLVGGALVLAGAVLVVERDVSSAPECPSRSPRPSSPSSPSRRRPSRPATGATSTSPSGTATAASPSSTAMTSTCSPATASR